MKNRYLFFSCNASVFLLILIVGLAFPAITSAQSNCTGPFLGENGPEVCISITETGAGAGAPVILRAPADFGDPPFPVVGTFGEYDLNLTVDFVFGGGGMATLVAGTVTRTTPGTRGISIEAEGGWGTPLPAVSGVIQLSGTGSGTARVETGTAMGFPGGTVPAQDIAYTGFPVTCVGEVLGPRPPGNDGAFQCRKEDIPVAAGAIATKTITVIVINEVGDLVEIQ